MLSWVQHHLVKVNKFHFERLFDQDSFAVLARGTGIAFIIQVMGTALKYLMQVIFARWMGPSEYGAYTFGFSLANLLIILAGTGLTISALRFVPQYMAANQWGLVYGYIFRSQTIVLLCGLLITLLGIAYVFYYPPQKIDAQIVVVGLSLVPFLALLSLNTEIVRATRNILISYAPPMMLQPLLVIISSYCILTTFGKITAIQALILIGVSSILTIIVQSLAIAKKLAVKRNVREHEYDTPLWLKVSFPLMVVGMASISLNQADILLVGSLLGTEQTGVYAAASKTASLVSFVLLAVNARAAPMIADLYSRGDHKGLQQIANLATRWMFWPSLLLVIGLFLAGKFILSFFGPEFVVGYWPMLILAIGQLVNASLGPVGYLLSLTGYERLSARIYVISALIHVLLNLLLIPILGVLGSAIATAFTMILWNVWFFILVQKKLLINPVKRLN
jgi:O-antigen/teichoic acid export membrane protein